MVVSGETHTVELTYAGQNISVTETSTSFYNERQKVQVSLAKAIEKDKTFGIGDNGEIKNISFGLYAAEDIVSASGTVIPADGLMEIVSVNENGTSVMKSDLPFGKYYVKEIATDEHYVLSDTKYPVMFEYAGQDTATVEIKVNDGKEIKNELIYGSVSGKKIDENGEALEGAVIGIFKAEETEFTKDTALMTTTSAKDGSFSFAKVPYGKWIVREIEQPKGFVLDEKAYEVNISKAEQVVEIEIVNEYVHGNIRLTKVDAEYPDNKLTGATFEVYKDTNENGKIDDGDELIGNLEETETGIYEMKGLLYGKYIVRETKAPEGFLLDKGEYSVFIPDNGAFDYQVLEDMVQTINENEVAPEERLSDHVYHYDVKDRVFERADKFEERQKEKAAQLDKNEHTGKEQKMEHPKPKKHEKIPAERMNGLKSVGFNLQEGSDYDGMMDLMVAGRSQREILDSIPFYKENKLVQEALKRVEQYIEEKSLNVEKTRPKEEKGEIQKTKSQKRREDMSL